MKLAIRCSIFLLAGSFCALPILAGPTNRYVSLNGGNTIPYDSWTKAGTDPYTVATYANSFNEGDTVWVSNGVYTIPASGDAHITVNNTIVKSFNTNVAGTIINGNGWVYGYVSLGHTNAWVEGLTISNGAFASGGGVSISLGTLTNCVVRNCHAAGGGGINFASPYTGLVANCTIMNNQTSGGDGGGVYITGNQSVLRNCTIVGNTARNGGGVYAGFGTIDNCDICYNVATNLVASNSSGGGGINTGNQGAGLIVTNSRIYGNTALMVGGGIFVYNPSFQSLPVFLNCVISSNLACCGCTANTFINGNGQGGGGIFAGGGIYSRCTISGNVSSNTGGGVHFYAWTSVMSNCVIYANTATNTGGGAHFLYIDNTGCHVDLYNCLIAGNVATNTGGGVSVKDYSGTPGPVNFYNCTIASNVAKGAGSVGGILGDTPTTSYFVNVVAYLNSGVSYSNWYAGSLNFSNSCTAPATGSGTTLDPRFTNPGAGDFHLIKGSPCIDKGLNQGWMNGTLDLDNRPRIRQGTVDMGPYEYFPNGTVISILGNRK